METDRQLEKDSKYVQRDSLTKSKTDRWKETARQIDRKTDSERERNETDEKKDRRAFIIIVGKLRYFIGSLDNFLCFETCLLYIIL